MASRKIALACLVAFLLSVSAPAADDGCPRSLASRLVRAAAIVALGIAGTVAVYEGPGWYQGVAETRARWAAEREEAARLREETKAALRKEREQNIAREAAETEARIQEETRSRLAPYVDTKGVPLPQIAQLKLSDDRFVFRVREDIFLFDGKTNAYSFLTPSRKTDAEFLFLSAYEGAPFAIYVQKNEKDMTSTFWLTALSLQGNKPEWHELSSGGKRSFLNHRGQIFMWDKEATSIVRVHIVGRNGYPTGMRLESLALGGVSDVVREGDDWKITYSGGPAPQLLSAFLAAKETK